MKNDEVINIFLYADDVIMLAPSVLHCSRW